jgi:hypothetical protein
VAEELGVQYVLEGSVQRSGEKLRVAVQLIDDVILEIQACIIGSPGGTRRPSLHLRKRSISTQMTLLPSETWRPSMRH